MAEVDTEDPGHCCLSDEEVLYKAAFEKDGQVGAKSDEEKREEEPGIAQEITLSEMWLSMDVLR